MEDQVAKEMNSKTKIGQIETRKSSYSLPFLKFLEIKSQQIANFSRKTT